MKMNVITVNDRPIFPDPYAMLERSLFSFRLHVCIDFVPNAIIFAILAFLTTRVQPHPKHFLDAFRRLFVADWYSAFVLLLLPRLGLHTIGRSSLDWAFGHFFPVSGQRSAVGLGV